jgi:ribosomal protein L11 methyltransferase
VLSICAARLGAKRVVAIELDHDAIGNAEENIAANRVSETVHVIEGDAATVLPLVAPAELILANIISSVLLEILPVIRNSLTARGHAILSGILTQERDMMADQIQAAGFVIEHEDIEEEWWSVLLALPR